MTEGAGWAYEEPSSTERLAADSPERVYLDLVAAYQTAILNYIHRLVGDRDVAEDLTQETFVRAYRALERLDLSADADARRRAWLYRIAHNAATDHLRRKGRIGWVRLDKLRQLADDWRGSTEGPEHQVVAADPVRRALATLTDDQREILILFNVTGMEAQEVGEIMGISADAARKRRQRARDAFIVAYEAATSGTAEEASGPS